MRPTLLLLAFWLTSCRAPQPREVSCKPKVPFAISEIEPPAKPRPVTLIKLPSGEVVEEVRR